MGYLIGNGGLKTDPSKVEEHFPVPRTLRQLRSFLGLAVWYGWFVKKKIFIISAMSDCSKKSIKFVFIPEALKVYVEIKMALSIAPYLVHPDLN